MKCKKCGNDPGKGTHCIECGHKVGEPYNSSTATAYVSSAQRYEQEDYTSGRGYSKNKDDRRYEQNTGGYPDQNTRTVGPLPSRPAKKKYGKVALLVVAVYAVIMIFSVVTSFLEDFDMDVFEMFEESVSHSEENNYTDAADTSQITDDVVNELIYDDYYYSLVNDYNYGFDYQYSFEPGVYEIGKDIPLGEYVIVPTKVDTACYGISGEHYFEVDDIDDENFDDFMTYMDYSVQEYAVLEFSGEYLYLENCTAYPAGEKRIRDRTTGSLPDGVYKVGEDFPEGEYLVRPYKEGSAMLFTHTYLPYPYFYEESEMTDSYTHESYFYLYEDSYVSIKGGEIVLSN